LHLPLTELVALAKAALRDGDVSGVGKADEALHFHFFDQMRRGKPDERTAWGAALLELADSHEVRQATAGSPGREAVRWEHLFQMVEALSLPTDLEQEAREFVDSRGYGRELLELVAKAEEANVPLPVGELARQLRRSKSTVVQVLGKMEGRGLVERRRDGRNVYVSLGLMGQVLMERKYPEFVQRTLPAKDWNNTVGPVGNAKSLMAA